MKKLMLSFGVTIFIPCLFAQTYIPLDNGSGIKFSIKNFGFSVVGNFKGLKGKISFNPVNLTASSINASVDAASINTGTTARDKHLKKEEYFDVEKFPLISFESTRITNSTKDGTFLLEGRITIKGVTKAVSFPFTVNPKGDEYLFEGGFKLNRRDFGLGGSSLVMSDNLTVSLAVLAKKN